MITIYVKILGKEGLNMKLSDACKSNKTVIKAIENAIRKSFRYSVLYIDAMDRALSTEVGPRGGKRYTCACCGNHFARNQVELDHKVPVIALDSSLDNSSLDELYAGIYCSLENLQVLCTTCHKAKTRKEARERAENRKKAKQNEENSK